MSSSENKLNNFVIPTQELDNDWYNIFMTKGVLKDAKGRTLLRFSEKSGHVILERYEDSSELIKQFQLIMSSGENGGNIQEMQEQKDFLDFNEKVEKFCS